MFLVIVVSVRICVLCCDL